MNLKSKRLKTLYYPGAGYDFSTLKYWMENSNIKQFYYCDYMNYDITEFSILQKLREEFREYEYTIQHIADLRPEYFNRNEWHDFWHHQAIPFGGSIENSHISLYRITQDDNIWELYYFGTEAIKTYDILLSNEIKVDVMVTQDHGLGGLWTSFCNDSMLEEIAVEYSMRPRYLFVGDDCNPWNGYKQISEPFGRFGLHEQNRIIYKILI
jgi:hypothetical protein